MTTWTLNGRTWGYSQADVPGQPYFLMGNQLFKTWHLLMQDLAAECAGVSSDSGLAEAARAAAVAAQALAEAARDAAVDSATDAGGSATAAVAAKNLAEAARDAAAASATAAGGSATAAAGSAAAANDSAVAAAASKLAAAASAAAAALDRTAAQTAATNASNSASAAAADRVTVAADKASVATALATAQALVGSAGTGTATGLVWPAAAKSLLTAADVVAVGIYSASMDSDRGAWRRRPFGSWYWETLSTSTRGARREFPKEAGWIARTNSFTIYDLNDLDASGVPKMWMVFGLGLLGIDPSVATVTGVSSLSGRFYVAAGAGPAPGGLYCVNFCLDRITRFGPAGEFRRTNATGGTIASRSSTTGFAETLIGTNGILSNACVGVAARVLPGAPLDSAGLPIPTVAVATAGGVSVIHPWGAVYDVTYAGGYRDVEFGVSGRLEFSAFDAARIDFGPTPYADAANTAWRAGAVTSTAAPALLAPTSTSRMVLSGSNAAGCADGLTLRAPDMASPANGMTAFVATNFNTLWQPGDVRGAWLCDTTTGSITGSGELVANGDFSSGATGWAAGANSGAAPTLAVAAGKLRVTNVTTSNVGFAAQTITTVAGQTYLIAGDLAPGGAYPVDISVYDGGGSILVDGQNYSVSMTGVLAQFTAVSASTQVRLRVISASAGDYGDFDNLSVRVALPDRSYNGRGLVPYGFLSLTALTCGLAVASGFSTANYLEQPYNPGLNFGTGDFSICWWARSTVGGGYYLSRDSASTGPRISLTASPNKLLFEVYDGAVGVAIVSSSDFVGPELRLWCAIRRADKLELWCDGALEAWANAGSLGSVSNTAAKLRVGGAVASTTPAPGLVAGPLCTSAYALTPDQIRKMYEDERAMIVGGAAATLGGTSNNVTSLAANNSTGTLDVYTSDGMSIFDRLSRLEYRDGGNSGAAIASDTMVAGAASGPYRLVATAANVGFIADAEIARDRMGMPPAQAEQTGPWAVTRNSTATRLSCPVQIREGESVTISTIVSGRHAAMTATEVASYRVEATVAWDYGGTSVLVGVATTTIIQETASGLDATIVVDAVNGLIFEQVWGSSTLPLAWTAERRIARNTMGGRYAA